MTLMKNFNKYFSDQAKLAMVGYALLSIDLFIPIKTPEEVQMEYNLSERVLSFVVMLLPIIVSVYTINCMVVGVSDGGIPCNILAWLNSLSIFVWAFIILLGTLMLLNTTSKPVVEKEEFSNCHTKEEFSNCHTKEEFSNCDTKEKFSNCDTKEEFSNCDTKEEFAYGGSGGGMGAPLEKL